MVVKCIKRSNPCETDRLEKFVLKITDLRKSYTVGESHLEILDGIDLEVAEGEFISILGASGTGKSTLLHLLGGLDRPDSGLILVDGHPIQEGSEEEIAIRRNRWIGFVFQFHHLLPEFTALENVMIPLKIRGMTDRESRAVAEERLDEVGLSQRLHHLPTQLSGGERQRVAIARALVTSPVLLLMDEPTGNLDPRTGDGLFDLLVALQKKKKLTVVMVTHNLELASRTDRRYLVRDGKLTPLEAASHQPALLPS